MIGDTAQKTGDPKHRAQSGKYKDKPPHIAADKDRKLSGMFSMGSIVLHPNFTSSILATSMIRPKPARTISMTSFRK